MKHLSKDLWKEFVSYIIITDGPAVYFLYLYLSSQMSEVNLKSFVYSLCHGFSLMSKYSRSTTTEGSGKVDLGGDESVVLTEMFF